MQNWSRVKQFQDEYNKGWMIGSAQKENEIYLDSVAGKFNTLKENLKGILTNNVSTGMFKDILDGANKVVVAVDKISQALGKIGTVGAIAGIASMVKSFKEFGNLDFFSGGGKIGILDTGFIGTLSSGFTNLKSILSSVWTGMAQGSGVMGTLKGGLSGLSVGLAETGVKAKLAQVGMGLLNGVLTGVAVAVAITAIKGLVTEFDNWINKSDKVVESSKNMQQSIQSEMQSLNTQKSSLSAIAKEYDTLAQKSNKTAEEMQRLSELKKQIAEISPDLVVGYDANNDPILALKGSLTSYVAELDTAIAKQKELYDQETYIQAREMMKENEKTQGKSTLDWMKQGNTDWLNNRTDKNQIMNDNQEIIQSYKDVSHTIDDYQKNAEQRHNQVAQSVQQASQMQRDNFERDALIQQHYLNQWAQNTKLSTDEAKSAFATFFTDLDWGRATEEQANNMAMGLQRLEGVTATSTTQMSAKFQQMTAEAKKAFDDTGAIQKYGQELANIARESGKFDLTSWSGYLDEVNQRFSDGEMSMEQYRHALGYVADAMEHLTGVDASQWLESFVDLGSVTANLESAGSGINKFMQAYNTSMSDLRKGDSFAVAVKEQFDNMVNFGKNLSYKIEKDIPVTVDWLLEQRNDLPKQVQSTIDAVTADGKVSNIEKHLMLAVTTEIQNEGQLKKETVDNLQKIFDGDLSELDMNAKIKIGDTEFVVKDLVKIREEAEKTKGGLEKIGDIDFSNVGSAELKTQIEEVRSAIEGIDNTNIRVAMDAQGFEKREEIEITQELIEGIDGEEAKVAFIAEAGEFIKGTTSVQDAINNLPPELKLKYQIGIEGDAELEALNAKYQALPKEVQTVITAEGSDYTMHDLEEIQSLCDLLGGETVSMLLQLEGGAEAIHTADTTEGRLKALADILAQPGVEIEGKDEIIKTIDEICKGLDEADEKTAEPEVDPKTEEGKQEIEEIEDKVDSVNDKKAEPEVNPKTEEGEKKLSTMEEKMDKLDGKNTESNHTANSDDSQLDETQEKIHELTQDTHGKITVHAETSEVVQAQVDKDRLEVDGKAITRVQVDGQGYYDVAINDKGQLEVNGVAQTTIDVQNGEALKFAINDKGELEVNGIAVTGVEINGKESLYETKQEKEELEQDGEATTTINTEDGQVDETGNKIDELDGKSVETEVKMTMKETIDNILSKLGLNKHDVNIEISVKANTSEATKQINSITSAKPGAVTIDVKAPQADSVKSKLDSLTSKTSSTLTVNVTAPNLSKIKSDVDALASKSIGTKSFTVSANGLADVTNKINTLANRKIATKTFTVNCTDNATSKLNAIINKKIATKTFSINCTDNASSKISSVQGKKISDKKFTINCTDSATSKVNKVQGLKISNKSFTISCKDNASGTIRSIKSAMSGLGNKTVTITVKKKEVKSKTVSEPRVVDGVGMSAPRIANEQGYVASANNIARATDNMNGSMVSAMANSVNTYANTGYTIRALKADVDLLTNISAVIEKITANLNKLKAQQERTWGNSEVKLLQQQITLLSEQQRLTKATEDNMKQMADYLRSSLRDKGFTFNNDGSIDNYNAKLISMTENVENLKKKMDAYTGDSESYKKSLSDAYNKANDALTQTKEQLDEYLDITFNGIPDAQTEWEQLKNSIADAKAEIIKATHEARVFTDVISSELREAVLEKFDTQIDILEVKMDLSGFDDQMKYLEQQIDLMNKAMDKTDKLIGSMTNQRNWAKDTLLNQGFEFDHDGNIENAEARLEKLRDSLSTAEYEALKEIYDEYVEIHYSTLPDLEKQWWDYKASIEETKKEMEEIEKQVEEFKNNAKVDTLEKSYEHLNEQLELLETRYDNAISTKDKTRLLMEQLRLMRQIKAEQQELTYEYNEQAYILRNELSAKGIKFDHYGSITNLEQIMNSLSNLDDMEELQDLADSYNDMWSNFNEGKTEAEELEQQIKDLNDEMLSIQKELENFKITTWTDKLSNGLKILENDLEKLQNSADLAGTNMSKNWDKQVDKINELRNKTAEMISFYKRRQNQLIGDLSSYGFEFNKDGSIDNYYEKLTQLKEAMSETQFELLNESLEEYFDINLETIPDLQNQLIDYEKELQDIAEEKLDIAKDIEDEITEMIEKQVEDRIEEIEKERDARIEALEKAKKAYEKFRDEADYKDDYNEQLQTVQDLQAQVEIAKRDTSLAGQKRLQELMEELEEEQKNLQELVRDKVDQDINDMFDNEMDRLEEDAEKEIEGLEEAWSSSKIAEAVKQALATGVFEDIDGNIMALDKALMDFAKNSEDYLGIMGDKMRSELIDNLGIALETVKELESIYKSLSIDDNQYLNSSKQMLSSSIKTADVNEISRGSLLNNVSIDSPININVHGNADATTISEMQDMLESHTKQMYNEILKYVK